MQLLRISFLLLLTITLSSFAYFSTIDEGRKQLYKDFLKEFERVNLPTKVLLKAYIPQLEDSEEEKPQWNSSVLGSEYGDFIPSINRGMMSRMGPSVFRAELMLATTTHYNAVIYSKSRSFDGGGKSYILATFNKEGKMLYSQTLGYAGFENQVNLEVTKKMEFTIQQMEIQGEEQSYEVQDTKKVFITPKGEILVHQEQNLLDSPAIQQQTKPKFTSL